MLLRFAVAAAAAAAVGRAAPSSTTAVRAAGLNSTDPAVVVTPLGPVRGLVGAAYRLFAGVPYAAPPTGARRWRAPAPVPAWGPGTLDATHDAPGCPQVCTDDEPPHICPAKTSEDCLYANVWTPQPAPPPGSAPVVLFIHGGNFHDGYAGGLESGGGLLYDGRPWVAEQGQVVVVINYRLGALGFLYTAGSGAAGLSDGNLGLQDQLAALAWVRANIAPFGGDPARVTLMGQSAGAMSISCHLTAPANAGLFTGAIMVSNPFGEAYRAPPSALAIAAAFSNFSGCGPDLTPAAAACLRAADTATLLAASHAAETDLAPDAGNLLQVVVAWGPTVGTPLLPVRPLEAFVAGNVLDVPIALGTTANESVIFVYEALNFTLPELLYDAAVAVLLGPVAAVESTAADLYPLPSPPLPDYRVFASTLLTDGLFLCATRNATEGLLAAAPGRASGVYLYQYDHLMSWGSAMWSPAFAECWNNVCHGSDLPALFSPDFPALGSNYTAAEAAMSAGIRAYLGEFVRSGAPGAGPGVPWPAYTTAERPTLVWSAQGDAGASAQGPYVANRVRETHCAWWDASVGYNVY